MVGCLVSDHSRGLVSKFVAAFVAARIIVPLSWATKESEKRKTRLVYRAWSSVRVFCVLSSGEHTRRNTSSSTKLFRDRIKSQCVADTSLSLGNDDSGTMGAFLAFTMMGLFPNPGQNMYFIIPPFFESVNITHPVTKKTATIRNVNFDANYDAIYIQKATLNGKEYTKNWIDHSFFTEGKELVLVLGRNESDWGTKVKDLPPSLSQYQF